MNTYYKGIGKDSFAELLKFVIVWEKEIRPVKQEKELTLQFPNCVNLFKELMKDVASSKKDIEGIKQISEIKNNSFVGIKEGSDMLSFLQHLRNSIVKGDFEVKNTYFRFCDSDSDNVTEAYALGNIKFSKIKSIIKLFLK